LRSTGFVGSVRVYGGDHDIVESKPADKDPDTYRIPNPFPAL